ncbi:MAG: aminoglycoside phosphotransferase [Limnohabitans sp.]|nr:aminoglycoside phosphotransferase [Limnohabitans sp.]
MSWSDSARQASFNHWLEPLATQHHLNLQSLGLTPADASFRRYFRIAGGSSSTQPSFIIMDAPPGKENCAPFVAVARLLHQAGLLAPRILNWDDTHGFMLLDDLGQHTMMQTLDPTAPDLALFTKATDALLLWQHASRPDVLPAYDAALLHRELSLFPYWYINQHKQITLNNAEQQSLKDAFDLIVAHNLNAPRVFVHRDFMPRNLMIAYDPNETRLGVLDFQDAVYGPITYDIASLMRDAFVSWDEEMALDVTIRYWERAKEIGLMDFEDWHQDFGAFYRSVEWMGLQRHLKVAGIFARLTLRDHKPVYLQDTPRFIAYIRHTCSRYRELKPLLRFIDRIEGTTPETSFAIGRI